MTTRYWLSVDQAGEPDYIYRASYPEGFLVVDVWYRGDWQDSGLIQADLDGLGGDVYRLIAAKDEDRFVARFKKTLAHA